jgi:hypothetical protein
MTRLFGAGRASSCGEASHRNSLPTSTNDARILDTTTNPWRTAHLLHLRAGTLAATHEGTMVNDQEELVARVAGAERRARTSVGIAVAALILGPAIGMLSAAHFTHPGPAGHQGTPGPAGPDGATGPPGPRGPTGSVDPVALHNEVLDEVLSQRAQLSANCLPVSVLTNVRINDSGFGSPYVSATSVQVCRWPLSP